jgi:immune inhibitor A
LPGEGLIIEHVDENQVNNTDENHCLVDIEQADGLQHLNININSGDAEDPYPTGINNSFTSDSTPSSKKYDSTDSQVAVAAIAHDGNDIIANVKVGSAGPQWINNVSVLRTYASAHSKNAYIMVDDLPGWKKIHEDSTDGVTNIYATACDALAFNRKVGLYIDENKVYSIIANS